MESSSNAKHIEKQRGGGCAAAKEACRIFVTTFLSLLPPLSFLLFARFSATRHQPPNPNHVLRPYTVFYAMSVFLHSTSTLVLSFLLFLVAVSAVGQRLAGVRRCLQNAVVWLSTMQVCLSLWIHGVAGDDRIVSGGVGSFAFLRNMVLPLGLYEAVLLWRRDVVKPVVDDAVSGASEEGFGWVDNVLLGVVFYCLWWWRLRREAEELVVVVRGNVEKVDVVGWVFYCVIVAIGGVRVVRILLWAVSRIFRRRRQPVNGELHAIDSVHTRC